MINGADVLLQANTGTEAAPVWTNVGSQRDVSISESVAAIDASSKDSRAARVRGGRYSSSISLDALYVPTNAAYTTLRTAFRAGTLIRVRVTESGVGTEQASVLITDIERSYPDQGESTISIDLEVDGFWSAA